MDALEPIAGFRNVVVHEYVQIDYGRVIAAVDGLAPIDEFVDVVARLEQAG